MRAIFGLLLVMMGVAMAVLWMPEHHAERQLAVVTEIATKGIPRPAESRAEIRAEPRPAAEFRGGRTFSPQTPLMAAVEPAGSLGPQFTAGVARVIHPVTVMPPAGTSVAAPGVVTTALPTATIVAASKVAIAGIRSQDGSAAVRSPAPADGSREELVRNIQRELKRVGCYYGDVDGDWGAGSRRAMSSFTERVNASLPVDHPDFILLTLLRGYPGAACGKGCPSGQSMADSGRCIPSAIMAQMRRPAENPADRRTAPREGERTVIASAADRQPAQNPYLTRPQPTPQAGAWATTVRREAITVAPLQAPTAADRNAPVAMPPAAAITTSTISSAPTAAQSTVAPLPGRMAIGGPQPGPQPGSGYAMPPLDPSLARDAVRDSADAAGPAAGPRDRRRRTARRGGAADWQSGYFYRYPVPVVSAYRGPARAYASASGRRGRGWTGSFFGANP